MILYHDHGLNPAYTFLFVTSTKFATDATHDWMLNNRIPHIQSTQFTCRRHVQCYVLRLPKDPTRTRNY